MVTEAEESMPSIDWVGPSSFLRALVARMTVILRLRKGLHIGQMERAEGSHPLVHAAPVLPPYGFRDLQGFPAIADTLEAEHEPVLGPDQGGPREQRAVLDDVAARRDVDVAVPAARDERAEMPVHADAAHVAADINELLEVGALDAASGL